ncbi:unnamed protein product [Vitrella brassicaformis CCMP3155]|uniref:Apple domain-containing protein n=1 Tax=Vitrella brassicaformis (strain CCMP3155) TaxID=1169540 RepID=A0A0G4EGT4_VITBC|nr:unnamed protein product [Vitrella brassicaformis CCMP3155]|eukprot:CEL95674.1 unnamed protein product [Vitrella brassicaformis CCMP3155]
MKTAPLILALLISGSLANKKSKKGGGSDENYCGSTSKAFCENNRFIYDESCAPDTDGCNMFGSAQHCCRMCLADYTDVPPSKIDKNGKNGSGGVVGSYSEVALAKHKLPKCSFYSSDAMSMVGDRKYTALPGGGSSAAFSWGYTPTDEYAKSLIDPNHYMDEGEICDVVGGRINHAGTACCSEYCGQCGGYHCEDRPGGYYGCCPQAILERNKPCIDGYKMKAPPCVPTKMPDKGDGRKGNCCKDLPKGCRPKLAKTGAFKGTLQCGSKISDNTILQSVEGYLQNCGSFGPYTKQAVYELEIQPHYRRHRQIPVEVSTVSKGTRYDTIVAVTKGCHPDQGRDKCLFYNDDAPYSPADSECGMGTFCSAMTLNLAPGTYFLYVGGFGMAEGNYHVQVKCGSDVTNPQEKDCLVPKPYHDLNPGDDLHFLPDHSEGQCGKACLDRHDCGGYAWLHRCGHGGHTFGCCWLKHLHPQEVANHLGVMAALAWSSEDGMACIEPHPGYEINGQDRHGMQLGMSESACMEECINDYHCAGYVWEKDCRGSGYHGGYTSCCQKKSSVRNMHPNNGKNSGKVVGRDGRDGGDRYKDDRERDPYY